MTSHVDFHLPQPPVRQLRLLEPEDTSDEATWRMRATRQVWATVAAIGVVVVLLFGVVGLVKLQVDRLDGQVNQLRVELLVNREIGYKNRAASCEAITAAGSYVPPICEEPEVLRYR